MSPYSLLRSLSCLRREPMHSSKVVPLPEHHSFTCCNATFKDLKPLERTTTDGQLLLDNVFCSVMKQLKIVANAIAGPCLDKCDKILIEEYLDDSVDLLDVCNFLLGRIEFVKRYSDSVQRALELVQSGMGPGAITRVKGLLGGNKYCKGDVSMNKCWSRLKRLVAKEKRRRQEDDDILIRSTVNAFDVCVRLDKALSFNKRRFERFSAGGSTKQMVELRGVIASAKELRDLTVEDYGGHVEELWKRCEKLVAAVGPLEERVKELYSQLVCVRVALLGLRSGL